MEDKSDAQSEPRVTILGEQVRKRRRHRPERYDRGRHDVVFGMLLLFGGIVLFANTLGLVSWDFWHVIAPFWPLMLVLVGVQIVFGRGTLGWLLMVALSLAVFGFVAMYGLLATSSPVAAWFPAPWLEWVAWFNRVTNFSL